MKTLFSQKNKLGALLLIAFGAILFWHFVSNNQPLGQTGGAAQQVTVPQIAAPAGWEIYSGADNNWKRGPLKVALAYPKDWQLNEEINGGRLNALTLQGGEYSIRIDQAGRDISRPYDYVRSIGGFDARVWKEATNPGQKLTFGITSADFVVHVTMQNDNSADLEKMLSSMIFYK